MATADQFRKLALSMPETQEKSHFGQPDFRVNGKIFADLSVDADYATLKLTPELQAAVIDTQPEAFYPAAGAWGRGGWTRVTIAHVELAALRELIDEAFQLVAPKRLLAHASDKPARQRRKQARAKR